MKQVESIRSSLESPCADEFQIEVLADVLGPDRIADAIEEGNSRSKRRRKLPAEFMIYFVILLGLYRRVSYANLLEKLHGTRWTRGPPGEKAPLAA